VVAGSIGFRVNAQAERWTTGFYKL
jgi:hypothetical protein